MEKQGFVLDNLISSEDFFDYSSNRSGLSNTDLLTNTIVQESKKESKPEYLISFSKNTENYCVGLVDMVDSTKISAKIGPSRVSRYYQVFLNSMSKIVNRYGGVVIKNIGDCLLFYFPDTLNPDRRYSFLSCLECGLAMAESQKKICDRLVHEGLPCLNYRISLDYGAVLLMKSSSDSSLDMIGSPINMCAKINRFAQRNSMVIGGDLHRIVKREAEYLFDEMDDVSLGLKFSYPVYSVKQRMKRS